MTGRSLFRQEVVVAQRQSSLGSIFIAAPPSRWFLSGLATTLGATLIAFLYAGHYTRREAVTGQLVPNAGLHTLTALNAGTITRLHVLDGQRVKQGEVLLELSTEQDSTALGQTHALVSEALDTQRQRLQADLQNQVELTRQQGDALRGKATLLRSQVTQLDGQLALQKKLVDSNQNLLDRIQPLTSAGYVSVFQVQQQQAALLDAQAQYSSR